MTHRAYWYGVANPFPLTIPYKPTNQGFEQYPTDHAAGFLRDDSQLNSYILEEYLPNTGIKRRIDTMYGDVLELCYLLNIWQNMLNSRGQEVVAQYDYGDGAGGVYFGNELFK